MPVSANCIAAVRAASGDRLSEAEATDLIRRMESRRDALTATGKIDNLEARLRAEAAGDADKARIAAAVAQKHAALAAIAYDTALTHIDAVRTTGRGMDYRKAALAFLEGTTRLADQGRNSVAATAMAYRARYMESFNLAVVRDAEVGKLVQHGLVIQRLHAGGAQHLRPCTGHAVQAQRLEGIHEVMHGRTPVRPLEAERCAARRSAAGWPVAAC